MPAITYHRPRRARSGDVLLQASSSSNSNIIGGSYKTLQTIFVICIALAAAFVIVLQYQSSEQLVETSIVATLENHDSSPQPTRPPVAQYIRTGERTQTVGKDISKYLTLPHSPQQTYPHRLDRYCARHIPAGKSVESLSSSISEQYGLEITNLVVTIRHGDRSAIHTLPNATMKLPPNGLVEPAVKNFTKFLNNLQLNIIGGGEVKNEEKGEDLSRAIDPKIIFQKSDFTLPQGQLTSRGFAQHLELGQVLSRAYGKSYLQQVSDVNSVYVRSTNYARTIQSVSALLIASVPHLTQKSQSKKLTIHTYADENKEIMHGVGLRSSSHGIQEPGQTSVESQGACPYAVSVTKTERNHFSITPSAVQAVVDLFGQDVSVLFPPELVDTSIPAYCHHRPLPCATSDNKNNNAKKCLENSHLENLMKDADRYYCDRYSGMHGGYEATKLATYPFLQEVKDVLLKLTTGKQFTIFSGHDTVIAPVLASLGIFRIIGRNHRPSSYCNWPGYASRIIFERYSTKSTKSSAVKAAVVAHKGEFDTIISAGKKFWDDHHFVRQLISTIPTTEQAMMKYIQTISSPQTQWIRVLFNGDDITQSIPTCLAEKWIISHIVSHYFSSADSSSSKSSNINQQNTSTASSASSVEVSRFIKENEVTILTLAKRMFVPIAESQQLTIPEFTLCSHHAFSQQINDLIAPASDLASACSAKPGAASASSSPPAAATGAK